MIFLYVLSCLLTFATLGWAVHLMDKDCRLSMTSMATALVFTAGFCVFPVLNFVCAWVLAAMCYDAYKAQQKEPK